MSFKNRKQWIPPKVLEITALDNTKTGTRTRRDERSVKNPRRAAKFAVLPS